MKDGRKERKNGKRGKEGMKDRQSDKVKGREREGKDREKRQTRTVTRK